MIDKKISLGTVITILTILATFIFTLGATSTRIDSLEINIDDNVKKISSNTERQQRVEIGVAKLETKMDEWGKRLETLIIEN